MKLCLNMIVKDEAPRILRCLQSVVPFISTWAIVDTGSTDDTPSLIKEFFADHAIDGSLVHDTFVDFSHTRNEALRLARIIDWDWNYLLLVDADMELVGEIPGRLTAAAYHMLQKGAGLTYWNTRLVRYDVDAFYVGVTHEYLDTPIVTAEKLHGPWFRDHADGGNRPGKLDRDIKLLEADVRQHPNNARSWYYLGQSYREAGHLRPARIAYNERIRLGGWDEEVFHAELSLARCSRDMGADETFEDTTSKFVRHAVAAYQMRPTRAEPLYDLARHYRDQGANTAALLFALAGSAIPKPDDILFVEDYPYEWGFKEEISICGFYSKEHREAGHDACEELALSQAAPAILREQSWNNLFHYRRPLSELAPSFSVKRIEFDPPDGYRPTNPSIVQADDGMIMNLRTVNYLIGDDGRYQFEGPIKTRNFLFDVHDDLSILLRHELKLPPDFPCKWGEVLGFEDVRLLPLHSHLYCLATSRQHNAEGRSEMVIARIDANGNFCEWFEIKSPENRTEKNWMPIIGKLDKYIYKCDPLQIIDDNGRVTTITTPAVDLRYCSGSTQAIPFDGGHLTMVHERQAHLDSMHGQRNYQQRFLWLDNELRIRKISRRFFFDNEKSSDSGQFPCGMCMHPDGERLVISYGVLDREAFLATVDADEVSQMLRDLPFATFQGVPFYADVEPIPPLGTFLEIPAVPKQPFQWNDLLKPSYNSVLKSESEVRCAIQTAESYGWPIHPDFAKNWDVVLAVNAVLEHTKDYDALILDAGADRRSTFMPTLHKAGYRHLRGMNILDHLEVTDTGVIYGPGNIEHIERYYTTQPPFLDFIACLSTIEHGVDVSKFLNSAALCLKPGGHLFVSTDFWRDPVVTPLSNWRIFTASDIMSLVTAANQVGLSTTSNVSFTSGDRVAHHAGLNYTFINLLFRKDG
jgi:predicted GH43/DUF377 family glycosyl hydrolase